MQAYASKFKIAIYLFIYWYIAVFYTTCCKYMMCSFKIFIDFKVHSFHRTSYLGYFKGKGHTTSICGMEVNFLLDYVRT